MTAGKKSKVIVAHECFGVFRQGFHGRLLCVDLGLEREHVLQLRAAAVRVGCGGWSG